MSGGGNWTGYIIGAVVGIVVGILTFGVGLAAYAGTAGLFAFAVTSSLLVKPSAGGGGVKNAVSDELNFASASESVVVPVIFGTQRIAGNYLRYDLKTFRAVPIYSESPGGGKGGGDEPEEVVVGYNYYLSFDYGLCMGPVDGVLSVWDAASVSKLNSGGAFTGGEELLTIKGQDTRGTARLYQGLPGQVRNPVAPYPDEHSNYRGVCYASFSKFFIGTQPVPKTHSFELYRWPRCYDAAGVEVAGLKIRGSDNEADAAWFDANPAAILYEILTNKTWGRGHSPDLLDIPSFILASQYYASKKLGLSFSLESQESIEQVIDSIRSHVNCVIIWTGEKLKCRCMMDIANNGKIEAVFTADSVSNVEFSRPTSPDTINELKLKFNNRENGYKAEIAQAQDDAGINVSGIVNSREIDLQGFSTRQVAESQASRILAELAYPQASLSFTSNRFDMKLEAGMLIRFDWNEWTGGRTQTFWRIAEISDANQDENGIQFSCVEDLYSVPYEGSPVEYQALIPPWEMDRFNVNSDLVTEPDYNETIPLEPIAPAFVAEMNIWATKGKNIFFIGANDGGGGHTGFNVYWSPEGGTEYSLAGSTKGKLTTGTLQDDLPGDGPLIRRGDAYGFRITLDDLDQEAVMLSSANKIATNADHMQVLPAGVTDLFIIGREIIQIGRVQEIGTSGVYTVTNYLRGAMGSQIQAHTAGAIYAYIPNYAGNTYTLAQGDIPNGLPVDLLVYPKTAAVEINEPASLIGPQPDGSFSSYGISPFSPSFLDGSKVGNVWTVKLRPRWHNAGAWSKDNLATDLNNLVKVIPEGYTFSIQPFEESSPGVWTAIDDPSFDEPNWVPDNGKNAAGGTITMNLTIAGAGMVRVYSYWQGTPCQDPVEFFA